MYEYKVLPAPEKGEKSRSVKTPEGRFALSIEGALNEMAAAGWEFLRAESLPSNERRGFAGTATHMRSLLVFRRPLEDQTAQFQPRKLETPPVAVAAPSVSASKGTAANPATGTGQTLRGDRKNDPILTRPQKDENR